MKRQVLIIGVIVVLVTLLAGAAFVGGRLFQLQQQAKAENNSQRPPRKLVTLAADVPHTLPDARGDVQRREGNSIFICDPINQLTINQDGTVNETGGCDRQFEVVIGHNTIFLHDITARQYAQATMPEPGEDIVLQQAVEPGSENDITEGTVLRVWGQLTGNRIVARTVLYWNRQTHPSGPGS